MRDDDLNLAEYGACRHRAVLDAGQVEALAASLTGEDRPGVRLSSLPAPGSIGAVTAVAKAAIGEGARPVRAILFDKAEGNNWSLGWHRDRTIAVRRRVDTPGFGPWTVKAGMMHVAPPFALLAGMVTVRLHLDPVDAGNARWSWR